MCDAASRRPPAARPAARPADPIRARRDSSQLRYGTTVAIYLARRLLYTVLVAIRILLVLPVVQFPLVLVQSRAKVGQALQQVPNWIL
jgi:hypothetical protein